MWDRPDCPGYSGADLCATAVSVARFRLLTKASRLPRLVFAEWEVRAGLKLTTGAVPGDDYALLADRAAILFDRFTIGAGHDQCAILYQFVQKPGVLACHGEHGHAATSAGQGHVEQAMFLAERVAVTAGHRERQHWFIGPGVTRPLLRTGGRRYGGPAHG